MGVLVGVGFDGGGGGGDDDDDDDDDGQHRCKCVVVRFLSVRKATIG